jgi:hypothetical protein
MAEPAAGCRTRVPEHTVINLKSIEKRAFPGAVENIGV